VATAAAAYGTADGEGDVPLGSARVGEAVTEWCGEAADAV